ncbi:helix-turn-helix domain-containing protein [Myxococcus qinghaiensis]|uniref:helix-turn-helix domain-containing protein n=1 Tax=Myxococcus qinghaiensis TaxID=2906758 RepID=UPI0020A71B23|nr:helix-turn-helix domain-containing protein [Myxococcus qinghaiensis]MCP3167247.1 helix-turn-helix domain-containing protein [Myxococcus qinghaiensis]
MKPFAQQTYYELLEVPVTAQMEEIHAAYSRLMELYAPDSIAVYALVDADQVDALRARMTEAMEILTDADLRVEYDKDLGLPARKVAEAVTAPAPVPEVGPTQRAAEALASAVEASASTSPVATAEAAGKGTEEPEPELSGPAAFRASFVSGYSLSYVTSSLQTAPFGGGFVGMPAAGRMDGGAASSAAESGSSAAPMASDSTSVEAGTESNAAAVTVAAPASVVAEAPSPAAPSSESPVAAPVASSPTAPSSESLAAAPVVSGTATPSNGSPVVAAVATTVQLEASSITAPSSESPSAALSPSDTASPSTADASAEAQVAQSPVATEPEPSVPEEPVVAQVPPAPSPVEDTPVPSVAAQPPVTEPEPPAPPSTSIVVSPTPSRSTGTSRPTSPAGASAQTRGPGRQLGDAQVLAQDAAIATAEAAMAQVSARVREVRPRLPDIPADAEFNGELLRRVRETRGFTLHQVADRTRISLRHLENVEADRYTLLPPPVYLRGILMNLARELGLDPLRVSRSYLGLASEKSGKK